VSDHWRELVGRLDAIEDQPELVDVQLNRCLLAMARYLVRTDRRKLERDLLLPGSSSGTQEDHSRVYTVLGADSPGAPSRVKNPF
jgi:hypothetical protein